VRRDQQIAGCIHRAIARHFGVNREQARIMPALGIRRNAGRFLGLDESLVKPP
jgi:hypothetical protein